MSSLCRLDIFSFSSSIVLFMSSMSFCFSFEYIPNFASCFSSYCLRAVVCSYLIYSMRSRYLYSMSLMRLRSSSICLVRRVFSSMTGGGAIGGRLLLPFSERVEGRGFFKRPLVSYLTIYCYDSASLFAVLAFLSEPISSMPPSAWLEALPSYSDDPIRGGFII